MLLGLLIDGQPATMTNDRYWAIECEKLVDREPSRRLWAVEHWS